MATKRLMIGRLIINKLMIGKLMIGVVLSVILLMSSLLLGCVNYKAYDTPPETDLIDEIAAIEEELGLTGDASGGNAEKDNAGEDVTEKPEEVPGEAAPEEAGEVEEEIILPDLEEETEEELIVEDGLPVISAKEKELVRLNLKVSDPDQDKVTYTFSPPLSEKGEWQTNYGDAGEYIITVTATDGVHTTEKRIKLVIERLNVPPVLEELRDIIAKEGDLITLEPKASDPNKDKVTITVSEPLSSGSFQTDHTSAGEYQIKVLASDGEMETEKIFRLTISDVNVLPEVSGLAETITVKEGEIVRMSPLASDLDEDNVKVTISEPVGNDGVWETGYTSHGEYEIKVTASDGKDTVVKKVKLVVEDVNMAPEIIGIFLG